MKFSGAGRTGRHRGSGRTGRWSIIPKWGDRQVCLITRWLRRTNIMKDILTLAAGLLLASSHCPAAETGAVFIWTNATANVGQYCLNPWTTASMNQAMAKLERFRKMARPVTLEDFLGSKPRQVRLISWEEDVNQALALVRDLLHSIILRPGRQGPTCGGITWAEGTRVTVRAFLEYEGGRMGILESDGNHLFFGDGEGTYWWHRWDVYFPREVRGEGSQPGGPANGSLPFVH